MKGNPILGVWLLTLNHTFKLKVLRRKENVLFNDALNTIYLRLYGVGYVVKNLSDSERGRKCFI